MSKKIHNALCGVLLLFSAASLLASLLDLVKPADDSREASLLSSSLSERLSGLDDLGEQLLLTRNEWPAIDDFPEDCIIYKYDNRQLVAWYNVFDLTDDDISRRLYVPRLTTSGREMISPLSKVGPSWSYVNYGHSWYLVKSVVKDNIKIIEGLLIKMDGKFPDADKADAGINPGLHVHGQCTIHELSSTEGVPVFVDGEPMMRLSRELGDTDLTYVSFTFLWLSLILFLSAVFLYVLFGRGAKRCAIGLLLMLAVAFLGRMLAVSMPDYIPFFSPETYSDGLLMTSPAVLVICNVIISLMIVAVFLCRANIARNAAGTERRYTVTITVLTAAALASTLYAGYYFISLLRNSDALMDVVRAVEPGPHHLVPLLSFAILFPCILLAWESVLALVSTRRSVHIHFTGLAGRISWCAVVAAAVIAMTAVEGFEKEQSRCDQWCRLMAFDSNVKVGVPIRIPPFYSYARYNCGHLSSFKGEYPYPTSLDEATGRFYGEKKTFVYGGYRHFLSEILDGGLVAISRPRQSSLVYIVYFTYLFSLFFLILMPFAKKRRDRLPAHSFQTKIRTLVVVSLSVTLVIMALQSIYYVYRQNSASVQSSLASKVSEVQQSLNTSCSNVTSWGQLSTQRFASKLDEISGSSQMRIVLYSPKGAAIAGPRGVLTGEGLRSRMPTEAYRNIMFQHKRYCIMRENGRHGRLFRMYAPIVNSSGNIVAIAGSQYIGPEVRFTRETLMHVAFTFSIFLLLLVASVVLSSSITASIFRPLLAMSRKMSGKDSQMLEQIEYEGQDELFHLIKSYNRMVENLKNSSRELAVAERDKAWGVMSRQVAHEIKNPLTPIKLEIQRLQHLRRKGDPKWEEKFEAAASVILEHIEILSNTADEFSTYAKLYTEEPVRIDLDKLIRDQVMLFEAGSVRINYLGLEGVTILGPRPQIIRMFVNLLTNAQQALTGPEVSDMPEGWIPEVIVSLRHSHVSGFVDVTVEDNGKGVAPENIDKMFVPNFTTKSGGTGLGLALCQSVAQKCGGSVSYKQSFTLGGACFLVTLPEIA